VRHVRGYSPYKLPTPLQSDQALANHLVNDQSIYLPTGLFPEFRGLIQRHYIATEHSIVCDNLEVPSLGDPYILGDVELFD